MRYLLIGENEILASLASEIAKASTKALLIDDFGEMRILSEEFGTLADSIYDFDDYLNGLVELEDTAVESEDFSNVQVVPASIIDEKAEKTGDKIEEFLKDSFLNEFDDIILVSRRYLDTKDNLFDAVITDKYLEDENLLFVIDRVDYDKEMDRVIGFYDYPVDEIFENLKNKAFIKNQSLLERIRGIFKK